jgi:hypothetical protein
MSTKVTLPEEALEFFRKTGRKGGTNRAKNLTAARRKEISQLGTKALREKARAKRKAKAA